MGAGSLRVSKTSIEMEINVQSHNEVGLHGRAACRVGDLNRETR